MLPRPAGYSSAAPHSSTVQLLETNSDETQVKNCQWSRHFVEGLKYWYLKVNTILQKNLPERLVNLYYLHKNINDTKQFLFIRWLFTDHKLVDVTCLRDQNEKRDYEIYIVIGRSYKKKSSNWIPTILFQKLNNEIIKSCFYYLSL